MLSPTTLDLKKMTEKELFDFLDAEAARIREVNAIYPLPPGTAKFAKVFTETYNDWKNKKSATHYC